MSVVQIVTILGSIPLFSMRTFLPAFLAALFLTYPEYFPGMGDIEYTPEGAFITRDWVLIVLGILSILEILGDKSSAIRNLVKNAETYLKPLIFLLINLSLLDDASVQVLEEMQWAAFDPMWILLGFGMLMVHWLAGLRRDFITFLEDVDEDDNFFIGRISSWMEDSLVLFGFFLLIWTGVLMVLLYAVATGFFIFMSKRYDRKLEQQKTLCPSCGNKNLPFAVNCFNCHAPQPAIHKIGIFGQRKEALVSNVRQHQLKLLSHRKCPSCGSKLKTSAIYQQCSTCGNEVFKSPGVKDFLKYQDKKFYKIAGISFFLGFIPIVGFVVSAVMANVYLFSPYRRYLPKGSSFLTKLWIRLITFLFFVLGIALGFIAAPVYIIMRYFIWKNKFLSRKQMNLRKSSSIGS